jgi:hypothetical protein
MAICQIKEGSTTMNDTTRRHPRTLEEAFGPYERGHVEEPRERMLVEDRIIITVCLVGAVALVSMMFAGWV